MMTTTLMILTGLCHCLSHVFLCYVYHLTSHLHLHLLQELSHINLIKKKGQHLLKKETTNQPLLQHNPSTRPTQP